MAIPGAAFVPHLPRLMSARAFGALENPGLVA